MKHCIFDLDGTLLDTLNDLKNAVNHAMRLNGMSEHSLEEVRYMVGNGVRKLMVRATPDADNNPLFDKVFADFREYYAEHSLDTTRPYDGIPELLAALKERGVKMAVVSNKMDSATKPLVKSFFGDCITVAIGESEGVSRKPAPDMVYKAMDELGVKPEECVYIGDSDVDFNTAKNSGLPCISVLWGFRDRAFLEGIGANLFAEKPMDVLDILENFDAKTPKTPTTESVVCFSFDHTMTTRSTHLQMLIDVAGVQGLLLNMLKELPALLLYLVGLKTRNRLKEQLTKRTFAGWSEEKLSSLCDYTAQRNKHLLRPELLQRLEDALAAGESVVIAASTPEPLIRAYLKEYPDIHILATQLDAFNGRLSGGYKGAVCQGMTKIRRLLELFPDRKAYKLTAYGSRKEDTELLDYADEGHWITRS